MEFDNGGEGMEFSDNNGGEGMEFSDDNGGEDVKFSNSWFLLLGFFN